MKKELILEQIERLIESRQKVLNRIEEVRMHHSIKENVDFRVDKGGYFGCVADVGKLPNVEKRYTKVRLNLVQILIQDYNDQYLALIKKLTSLDIVDRRDMLKVLFSKTKQQYKETVEKNMELLSKVEDIGNVPYDQFDVSRIPDKMRYSLTSIKLLEKISKVESDLITNLTGKIEEKNASIK